VLRLERPTGRRVRLVPDTCDVLARGRPSAAIDLKARRPADLARVLGRSADVLEGLRPGGCERLGVGPEDMLAAKPALVYARITGWGQDGPRAKLGGHDVNYIAVTDSLAAIGERGAAFGAVGGSVLGVDGQPIRQTLVTVLRLDGRPADWIRADDDGRYTVVLPGPGTYVLVPAADGWSPLSQVVTFTGATPGRDIHLLEPLTLSGRVVAGGRPLAGAFVSVNRPTGESVAFIPTDGSGGYAIPLPATGRYIIIVVAPDHGTVESHGRH